ncbi:MAG: hypothetical protein AABY13_05350, partial [Nanoarchaeota archaeon]
MDTEYLDSLILKEQRHAQTRDRYHSKIPMRARFEKKLDAHHLRFLKRMKEQSRYSLETDIEIANELHRLAALFESGETTGDPLVDAVIATTIGSCTGYDYKRRFTELDKFRQTIVVNAGQYAAFRLDQVVCVPSSVPWDPRHSHNCITVIGKLSRQPFFIGNHTRGYKIGVSMELPAILT